MNNYRSILWQFSWFVLRFTHYLYCFLPVLREILMSNLRPRISVDYAQDATVITLTDEKILRTADIIALEESIMPLIEAEESARIVIDFTNVQFLSSSVLGLLIRISKKIYEQDGQLRLCNINPKIFSIFKITRLDKIFDICNNLSEAIKSLPKV